MWLMWRGKVGEGDERRPQRIRGGGRRAGRGGLRSERLGACRRGYLERLVSNRVSNVKE